MNGLEQNLDMPTLSRRRAGTRRTVLLATLSMAALLAIAAPVSFDGSSLVASSQAWAHGDGEGGGNSGPGGGEGGNSGPGGGDDGDDHDNSGPGHDGDDGDDNDDHDDNDDNDDDNNDLDDDDGTPDQGPGDVPPTPGSDDGTPDQGPGDNP